MTRSACQAESIGCTATRSIKILGGGGQCGLQGGECGQECGLKGAVSAEISLVAPAICHYLMVNPSVSVIGSCQAKSLYDLTNRQ